jgi:hypothetical protein
MHDDSHDHISEGEQWQLSLHEEVDAHIAIFTWWTRQVPTTKMCDSPRVYTQYLF